MEERHEIVVSDDIDEVVNREPFVITPEEIDIALGKDETGISVLGPRGWEVRISVDEAEDWFIS